MEEGRGKLAEGLAMAEGSEKASVLAMAEESFRKTELPSYRLHIHLF